MSPMPIIRSHHLAVLVVAAAAMLPASVAHAQYYAATTPPPLYPYVMQNSGVQASQPYAIQVAPNTYVIERNAPERAYPSARRETRRRGIINTEPSVAKQAVEPAAGKFDRPHRPVDHALVEELRQRKSGASNSEQVVRDAPVVIEHRQIVDDPPRIIERRHVVEDQPDGSQITVDENAAPPPAARADTKKRVIQADAEVTILGPDRMSIRLFRKGQGPKANARAD
jgi:hypothetical protein